MVNGNASLPSRYSFQPFERVRIFANQQHQGGGLRIGFSAARPCSHFSRVLSLIRSLRAKTAREQRSFLRVSRMSFESTLGSGAGSIL